MGQASMAIRQHLTQLPIAPCDAGHLRAHKAMTAQLASDLLHRQEMTPFPEAVVAVIHRAATWCAVPPPPKGAMDEACLLTSIYERTLLKVVLHAVTGAPCPDGADIASSEVVRLTQMGPSTPECAPVRQKLLLEFCHLFQKNPNPPSSMALQSMAARILKMPPASALTLFERFRAELARNVHLPEATRPSDLPTATASTHTPSRYTLTPTPSPPPTPGPSRLPQPPLPTPPVSSPRIHQEPPVTRPSAGTSRAPLGLITGVIALAGLAFAVRWRGPKGIATTTGPPPSLRPPAADPGVREGRQALLEGRLYLARGQTKAALAALNKACAHGPQLAAQAHPMLLIATLREGNLAGARPLWDLTDLSSCPTSVLVDMAQELEKRSMSSEARSVYDVILQRNPVLKKAASQVARLAQAEVHDAELDSGLKELLGALPERFTEVTRIDRGGMGVIYRAHDRKLGRPIAIKTLSAALRGNDVACKRFLGEARALARLTHPAIPAVHDVSQGTVPYFVMDLLPGEDLQTVVDRDGALGVARVVQVARQVLGALGHAHSRGILHRDIKPGNIIVAPDGAVKLVDFGIARILDATSVTETSAGILGTMAYIAPEQINGETVSERTDIYSLGATLFHLLTGRMPFPDNPVAGNAYGTPPAPSSLNAQIPRWIDRIILACMEKAPARRPGSAQELLKSLGEAGEPLTLKDGFSLASELEDLHDDTLHGIVNALAHARRFAGDPQGFAGSFFAPEFLTSLRNRFEGPQGVITRLDRLTTRWLVAPEMIPDVLQSPARPLGLLGQGRSDLIDCLATLKSISTPDGHPRLPPEDLQTRILGHLEKVARLTSQLKQALSTFHLPVLPLLEALARRHAQVRIPREIPSEITVAVLDGPRAAQDLGSTLDQLVENALQAGAHRVEVRVEADVDRGGVDLTLSDDGRGMSAQEIEEAFVRPFTTREGGTGTGLIAAARVVADLRGRITASPAASGHGLTIRLHLPTVF